MYVPEALFLFIIYQIIGHSTHKQTHTLGKIFKKGWNEFTVLS